jgi:hypothetical protein
VKALNDQVSLLPRWLGYEEDAPIERHARRDGIGNIVEYNEPIIGGAGFKAEGQSVVMTRPIVVWR